MNDEQFLDFLYAKMVEALGATTYEDYIADGGAESKSKFEELRGRLQQIYETQRLLLRIATEIEESLLLR